MPRYTFDDIRASFDLLASLYAEFYLEQPEPPETGQPYRAAQLLEVLGRLREPLNEHDKRRFDRLLEEIVAMKLRAANS